MEKVLKKIRLKLEQFKRERFTGKIVVQLFFNQGGIRDYKVAREKEL